MIVPKPTFTWECDVNIHPIGIRISIKDLVEKLAHIDDQMNRLQSTLQSHVDATLNEQVVIPEAVINVDFWWNSLSEITMNIVT